jgi:hypothetical protein
MSSVGGMSWKVVQLVQAVKPMDWALPKPWSCSARKIS